MLPYVDEPIDVKGEYNQLPAEVREAALRQSSDFSKLVYRRWKGQLRQAGLTWQNFLADASMNREAWRAWLDEELPWRLALEALVERLNRSVSEPFAFE